MAEVGFLTAAIPLIPGGCMETMLQQSVIFSTLLLVLVLFVWGRWRYDIIAGGILNIAG